MTEIYKGADFISTALTPDDLVGVRVHSSVTERLIDTKELDVDQKNRFQEVLDQRKEEALHNEPLLKKQILNASLYASEIKDKSRQQILLEDTVSLDDVDKMTALADVVLGLKARMAGGRGGRRGSVEQQMVEDFANNPQAVEEFQKSNPVVGAAMGGPPGLNFYQAEYLLTQGYDSFRSYDKLVRGNKMLTLPEDLDPAYFGELASIDWEHPTDEQALLAEEVSQWQWHTNMLPIKGGPFAQVARLAPHMYTAEIELDGSTSVAILSDANTKCAQFYEVLTSSTEKATEELIRSSPKGTEVQAILQAGRLAIPVHFEEIGVDGEKHEVAASYELGAARALDSYLGGDGTQIEVSAQKFPLYTVVIKGSQFSGTMSELIRKTGLQSSALRMRETFQPVFKEGDSPVRAGRVVPGQGIYTMSEEAVGELAKGPMAQDAERQLINKGMKLKNLERLGAFGLNGKQLNRNHHLYKHRYDYEKAKQLRLGRSLDYAESHARVAAAKRLIDNTAIVSYGAYADQGFQLSEILGFSAQLDPKQNHDKLPELWNKMMTTEAYDEKYGIRPAVMRKMVQSYIRNVLAWKRKIVDPILISTYGNKENVTASWRNPLHPEKAPIIPNLSMQEGLMLRYLGKVDSNGKQIVFDSKGFLVKDLGKPNKEGNLMQVLVKRMKDGKPEEEWVNGKVFQASVQGTIEGILYQKMRWRSNEYDSTEAANHLVQLAINQPDKAISEAQIYTDRYLSTYYDMAPQEFPRTRTEAMAVAMSLIQERRQMIEAVNFQPLLESMGYKNMGLQADEYIGMTGLFKLIEMRSNKHWLTGQVEKWFKYMGKYPEVAISESKALDALVPALNNCINPLYESLVGVLPDRMTELSPDKIGGAFAELMVNILYSGKRKQGQAWDYIKEVIEAMTGAAQPIGYMSGFEQRANVKDMVTLLDTLSDKAVMMAKYEYDLGNGEHGSSRHVLEIPTDNEAVEKTAVEALRRAGFTVVYPWQSDAGDFDTDNLLDHEKIRTIDYDALNSETITKEQNELFRQEVDEFKVMQRELEKYEVLQKEFEESEEELPSEKLEQLDRYQAIFSDETLEQMDRYRASLPAKFEQMDMYLVKKEAIAALKKDGQYRPGKPYVSWGIQPIYSNDGTLTEKGEWLANGEETDVLGLYGHKGKETLLTLLVMEYLQDKMLMTRADADDVVLEVIGDFFGKDKNDVAWRKEMLRGYYVVRDRMVEELRTKIPTAKDSNDIENGVENLQGNQQVN